MLLDLRFSFILGCITSEEMPHTIAVELSENTVFLFVRTLLLPLNIALSSSRNKTTTSNKTAISNSIVNRI